MTEGPTPRDPRDEPPREPPGGPDAPVDQPPPAYRPADDPQGPSEGPRWDSPGTPPPPPPPPPAPGGQDWGQQGGDQQQPGGYQQGGYPQGGYQQQPGGYPPQPAASGMAENVASGLSYAFTWVTGLVFFLVDKRPEVRFHAMQSIVFGVFWTLVWIVRPYMPGPIGALLGLVWLAFLVGWIVLMVQGFQGKHFKLPVIGDFAEQQAGRPGL